MITKDFIFYNTYKTWNKLAGPYHTPAFKIEASNTRIQKNLYKIGNFAKKNTLRVAYLICTLATGIFDLLSLPYRYYIHLTRKDKVFRKDISSLTTEKIEQLRHEIVSNSIEEKLNLPKKRQEELIEMTIAQYGRSKKYYAPVAVSWVNYLLCKANRENKKLVFMARDGTAPYKLAIKMLKKYPERYPNLDVQKIILAYFSRKVIAWSNNKAENLQITKAYTKQLGIAKKDRCIFVDIGFRGSTINSIRNILGSKATAEFEFLISKTEKARGFLAWEFQEATSGDLNPQVLEPAANAGIHWLEDSHQGIIKSPSHLIQHNNIIYPNTLDPRNKQTFINEPVSFLLRKWGQKAITRALDDLNPETIDLNKSKLKLQKLLSKISDGKVSLYLEHV